MGQQQLSNFAKRILILQKYKKKLSFWRDSISNTRYDELNTVTIPDLNTIRNFQLEKLRRFSSQAFTNPKIEKINNIFFEGSKKNYTEKYQTENNKALGEALKGWAESLQGITPYTEISQQSYNSIQENIKAAHNELKKIINDLKANNNIVLTSQLNQLSNLINNLQLSDFETWIKNISAMKGQVLEEIGIEWLKAQNIPIEFLALNTGKLENFGNSHKGQLIQDIVVLDLTNPSLWDAEITFRVANKKQPIRMRLFDFFKHLNNLNQSSKHIILDDKSYEFLTSLSLINIQAKSGLNQLPWNSDDSSTWVAINDFTTIKNGTLTIKNIFKFLYQLKLKAKNDTNKYWDIKSQDSAYQSLVNYGLATALAKVLHLSPNQCDNQALLTPEGFISYYDRIKIMFSKPNAKFYMKKDINLEDGEKIMSTPHAIGMTGYSN